MSNRVQTLSLLSGKGGSGKTVLGLCICRALSEAGYKVLLVDCDFATHGATYFFEDKLRRGTPSLTSLTSTGLDQQCEPIEVENNFWFLPSSSSPEEIRESSSSSEDISTSPLLESLVQTEQYDVALFDCQAGYSPLTQKAAELSDQNIMVMEPDAVSSAALRVLFLQLGSALHRSNTWQLFNKITEDEREVYEKLSGGTLFPNLPPIPFDWQVRAAFATSHIPSVTSKSSAFGLGVLRILKIIFPDRADKLEALEQETVGNWHNEVVTQMEELKHQKDKIEEYFVESDRRARIQRVKLTSMSIAVVGALASVTALADIVLTIDTQLTKMMAATAGIFVAALAYVWYGWNLRDIRRDRDRALRQDQIKDIERELERYSTLLATDPWLREYSRQRKAGIEK